MAGSDDEMSILKGFVAGCLEGGLTSANLVAALREFDVQLFKRQAPVRPRLRTLIEELDSAPSATDAVAGAWARFAEDKLNLAGPAGRSPSSRD